MIVRFRLVCLGGAMWSCVDNRVDTRRLGMASTNGGTVGTRIRAFGSFEEVRDRLNMEYPLGAGGADA